jgi:hypothetical protein
VEGERYGAAGGKKLPHLYFYAKTTTLSIRIQSKIVKLFDISVLFAIIAVDGLPVIQAVG